MTISHIAGRVVATSPAGKPLPSATVFSKDKRHAILQTAGHFATLVAKAKTYTLPVSAPGYQDKKVSVAISAADLKKRKVKYIKVKLAAAKTGPGASAARRGRPSKG